MSTCTKHQVSSLGGMRKHARQPWSYGFTRRLALLYSEVEKGSQLQQRVKTFRLVLA